MKPLIAEKEPSEPAAAQGEAVRPRLIPGSDQTEGEIPASPQEEADVEQAVNKCLMMIHGRKSRDAVLKSLHDPNASVAQTVGRLAVQLIMQVNDQKRAATNEALSEDQLREVASYIVPELLKVGCAAGIFPFDDPDSDEPGAGADEFDEQARLSMLEAVKFYGEQVLKQPGAETRSAQAGDEWAANVEQEVQDGTASPEFLAATRKEEQQPAAAKQAAPPAPGKSRELIREK